MTLETTHADRHRMAADHLVMNYTRHGAFKDPGSLPIMVGGAGPHLIDDTGRRFFDLHSNLVCAQLGYSYGAEVMASATARMAELPFASTWGMAHPVAADLAARLATLSPPGLDRVLFTSGGSEAVESAWKVALQYHHLTGSPRRTKAIARRNAYHGSTIGALALTGVEANHVGFGKPVIDTRRVSWTNGFRLREDPRFAGATDDAALTDALLAEIEAVVLEEGPETIAMLIAEPIQNAGGALVPPAGYWSGLRALADTHGFLLVADEVISGFGRAGEWFASTLVGAQPDMITTAKGLSAAYAPLGALFLHDKVADPFYADPRVQLKHGFTYSGHPLCAAVSMAVLDVFERDEVLENVRSVAPHLQRRLDDLRGSGIVGDVRGCGFFWAVELVADERNTRFGADERDALLRGFLPAELRRRGILARPDDRGDSVLPINPPLICTAAELDRVVDEVAGALQEAEAFMAARGGRSGGR